jgi:hypothetical protein
VLDPAASGLAGLTVWGEDPKTGHWYNVAAQYLKGGAATELLAAVEAAVAPWAGPGLLRVCDCNPAGFYREAARQGVPWRAYTEKNDRKLTTINLVNETFLASQVWLTDASQSLEDELVKCSWSARDSAKIANSSSYHLTDTMRYAMDSRPVWDNKVHVPLTETQELRKAWKARQLAESQARAKLIQRRSMWTSRLLSSRH